MKPGAAPESHRLKFHWPARPQISLALIGFLLLSFLAHGLAFYLFQVVYPPVVAISPPPVQVSMLAPTTPENISLLRWVDSEDPAAIANPHEIVPGNLYDIPYQRSFTEIRTAPKSPDEKVIAVPFPPALNSLDIIGSVHESHVQKTAILPASKTELKFSGALAGRKITNQPALEFKIPAGREPASFLVGVGPDGKVLYTFFMGAEMDDKMKAIDRQAEEYLARVEFAANPAEITWGMATYFWGNDAFQPDAQKP